MEALKLIAEATRGTEFEGALFSVGGAVRDALLNRPTGDLDLVTELPAEDLVALLVERGVAKGEPQVYARFGTAMVRVAGHNVEIVRARRENYRDDSRKPDVEPATFLEDAQRRDFTVNTLQQNLHTGEIVDRLGSGLEDLRKRVLRTPLDPDRTFAEDPLRMLRAVRLRHQLGFTFAPGLSEAVTRQCERLAVISAERIRDEFAKMLVGPVPHVAVLDLADLGLLAQFAPEIVGMRLITQGGYHHLDVFDHSLVVLQSAPRGDLDLALAALLHDVGKPLTRSIDARGHVRFFQHERVGAEISIRLLSRLRFAQDQIGRVAMLVRNHMRFTGVPEFTDAAARRLLRDLGDQTDALLRLVEADIAGLRPGVEPMDLAAIRAKVDAVRTATPVEVLRSPLSGQTIMRELGLEPGPAVGRAKDWLLDKVLEGTLEPENAQKALELLRTEYRQTDQ